MVITHISGSVPASPCFPLELPIVRLSMRMLAMLPSLFALGLATHSVAQETGKLQQPITVHENCNEGQRSRMERAITIAQQAVAVASREVRQDSPFFRAWFGEWSKGNADVVRYYLDRISDAWDGLELRCGHSDLCSDDRNAFYQQRPVIADRFTVCDGWHKSPPLSVEANSNRAGVIIHEISHGVGSPGTLDVRDLSSCSTGPDAHCYGADNARNLTQDPTCTDVDDVDWIHSGPLGQKFFVRTDDTCKALYNAENYEHFVSDVLVNTILLVNR
jgi:hypothetical protein